MAYVKEAYKEKLERKENRIKSLYFYLRKEKTPVSTSDLVDLFGYSATTLLKDLELLKYNNKILKIGRNKWQYNMTK